MPKIYRPTSGPDDWKSFLAEPKKRWKTGFSARTLAHCWEHADGLRQTFAVMVEGKVREAFAEPLVHWLEHSSDRKRTPLASLFCFLCTTFSFPNHTLYHLSTLT